MRILVVEDDGALRESLRSQLVESGFGVDTAGDGREALLAGLYNPFDGALVDVGLPSLSGLEVIQQWRRKNRGFPVVVLTARKGWEYRVEGLTAGADDYVEKPFRIEEVIARIRCVLRRSRGWSSSEIVCGPFSLDTHRLIAFAHGKPLDLTSFELRLLQILMLNAPKVLSVSALMESLYDHSADHDSNIVQHFICRLRRKLDPKTELHPIETVHREGYRFAIARGSQS